MYISILYTLHFLYYSYITILIVNPSLKIFQIFLRRKIFYRFVFWKEKKKKNYCDQNSNDVEDFMYWHIRQTYLFYYTLIFRSRFHNKSGTRFYSYVCTELHLLSRYTWWFFFFYLKGHTFYCARLNPISP